MKGFIVMAYFEVRKKYLAEALSYIGFKYYKFTSNEGYVLYSFLDIPEFKNALTDLLSLKDKYGTHKQ